MVPGGGAHLEPAFPVGAPGDFLEEFLGGAGAVFSEDGAGGFFLGDEAGAEVGGELGDAGVMVGAEIEVPGGGVFRGEGEKFFQLCEGGGACGREGHCWVKLRRIGVPASGDLSDEQRRGKF